MHVLEEDNDSLGPSRCQQAVGERHEHREACTHVGGGGGAVERGSHLGQVPQRPPPGPQRRRPRIVDREAERTDHPAILGASPELLDQPGLANAGVATDQHQPAGTARGTGGLVLISGDAGIGKSRLVQELGRRAENRGMIRAFGFAVDDPGAPSLWPWRRALRDLPQVAAALDGAASSADMGARFSMFVTFADRLLAAAGTQGIVVLLEDMHWADQLSVLLLTHLCSELPDSRVGVVISYRPSHRGALRAGLDRLIRGRSVTHVTLDGLTRTDIEVWLREFPGLGGDHRLAENLRERTSGNPLLIRLLAEALVSTPAAADHRPVERLLAQRADLRR